MEQGPKCWIDILVFCFSVIGLFGNTCLIVAVLTNKHLRNKSGCLIGIASFVHWTCLMFELYSIIVMQDSRFDRISQQECFKKSFVLNWCLIFQAVFYSAMAFDMFFSITYPLKHLTIGRNRYLIWLLLPCFTISIMCMVFIYTMSKEGDPAICISVVNAPPLVYHTLSTMVVLFNFLTVLLAFTAIYIGLIKAKKIRQNRGTTCSVQTNTCKKNLKIFRSTFVMTVVYITSWFLTGLVVTILLYKDQKIVTDWFQYLEMTFLPTFCHTYFVTFARSPKFKKVYLHQLSKVTCGLIKQSGVPIANSSQNNNRRSELATSIPETPLLRQSTL